MSTDEDSIPAPPPSLVPPRDGASSPPPRANDSSRPPASVIRIPPSRSSRSLPPLPAIEPILDEANAFRLEQKWDAALDAYKKALFLVDPSDTSAQASLYANVAEVKLSQGKLREAETNFEKALSAQPKHVRSIDGLIVLATSAKEWDRAVQFRKKRAASMEDEDERVAELVRAADVYEREAQDPKKAAEVLESATFVRPDDVGLQLKLRLLYEGMGAWKKVLEVLETLVRISEKPRERGNYRFNQADIVLGRFRDEPRGLAFLELALDEDPQNDRALSAFIAVRTRREEWAELAAIYERLVDRFAGLGDRERAWEVCKKLGVLRRDRLTDGPGALEAFRGALEVRSDDVESRAALAELYANKGDRAAAVRELEKAAEHAPFRGQTYRRLHELHARASRSDRAWLVATCLEELGAADVSHELVIEQFRPDGPIRPTTALEEELWDECLRAEGRDPIVCEILRTVGEVAISQRVDALAAKGKLPALEMHPKQDKSSTASVVRTFVWAARALGIALPDIYLMDDVPHGIAAIPAKNPSIALGPEVRTGMTVQQLAFLAGRHLTYYRPEHYALVLFPTLADLSLLVLSAVKLVIPAISVPSGEPLDLKLSEQQREKLERAVAQLDARGGKLDLMGWIRHVELTAARAGLLLAGDLRVAMRTLHDEDRAIGELSRDTKRGDLLSFTAAECYGKLREKMGVAILSG